MSNEQNENGFGRLVRRISMKFLNLVIIPGVFLVGFSAGACTADKELTMTTITYSPIPKRESPRPATTGSVPHQQIDVQPVPEVNAELFRRAFSLPGVENRPSAFSLPGARGLWINDSVPIVRADQIVAGREFAHIHPDGSLHASLPLDRALEAIEAGWAEAQPIADSLGIPGLVMLYTPLTLEELETVLQLIIDSYNFVTGAALAITDLEA